MAVRSAQTSQTKTKWTPIIFFSTARDNKWRGRRAGRPGQDHKLQGGQEASEARKPAGDLFELSGSGRNETDCPQTRIPRLCALVATRVEWLLFHSNDKHALI
jgi:hypothetical protein